jgi:predicted amidohydrolase
MPLDRSTSLSHLRVVAAQAAPLSIGADLSQFETQCAALVSERPHPQILVFPELHLFGADEHPAGDKSEALRQSAVPLDGTLVAELGAIARRLGVWLLPGSICERGPADELSNTAVLFAPEGDLVASYRKVFPWRPYEPYQPGDRFVVAELPGIGRVGLSICYDAWFPEVARHLAWYGADVVLNVVKTTTPDRPQEVVLARANSIVNQVFTVSVNCAGPPGMGQSLVVDPEGTVLEQSEDARECVLVADLDLGAVANVRRHGTAGLNRMWSQFLPDDAVLELPLYDGRIAPQNWEPRSSVTTPPAHNHSSQKELQS